MALKLLESPKEDQQESPKSVEKHTEKILIHKKQITEETRNDINKAIPKLIKTVDHEDALIIMKELSTQEKRLLLKTFLGKSNPEERKKATNLVIKELHVHDAKLLAALKDELLHQYRQQQVRKSAKLMSKQINNSSLPEKEKIRKELINALVTDLKGAHLPKDLNVKTEKILNKLRHANIAGKKVERSLKVALLKELSKGRSFMENINEDEIPYSFMNKAA